MQSEESELAKTMIQVALHLQLVTLCIEMHVMQVDVGGVSQASVVEDFGGNLKDLATVEYILRFATEEMPPLLVLSFESLERS